MMDGFWYGPKEVTSNISIQQRKVLLQFQEMLVMILLLVRLTAF